MIALAQQSQEEKLAVCRQYLLALGADELIHSGRHFLTHLEGTYLILRRWGLSESVCYAGLFHSIYGTDSFKRNPLPLEKRDELKALIGAEAEQLAYLFGSVRRITLFEPTAPQCIRFRDDAPHVPIIEKEWVALLHMEYANTLEQVSELGVLGRFVLAKLGKKWFHLKQHLTTACNAELESVFGSNKMSHWQYSMYAPLFWVLQRL